MIKSGINVLQKPICLAPAVLLVAGLSPSMLSAQAVNINELFVDLTIVEKEESAAKQARLNWIDSERTRIRGEIQKHERDVAELRGIQRDASKQREAGPLAAANQRRDKLAFNQWASNNNPALNTAVVRGVGINALIRVLGPIAHARQMRSQQVGVAALNFPALAAINAITRAEAMHFRMAPATSAGSKVVVRLNRLPLDIQWPPILVREWPVECRDILKLKDAYVAVLALSTDNGDNKLYERADVLDSSLELLQVLVVQKRKTVPHNSALNARQRIDVHRDLQDALRYLETIRATAERFKKVPREFRIHEFPGGTIEDFLDFCYTHGMIFQQARPDDESEYFKVYRRLQDYAHDLQFVEDWKDDLTRRIDELNAEDKKLVWQAAAQ